MNSILILLAVSSLLGLVLASFSRLAIGVSGLVLAFLSAVVLQYEGFGFLAGIAIIVACLTVNQIAYLIPRWLFPARTTAKLPSIAVIELADVFCRFVDSF
jgi:hypothetical protein